MEDLNRFAAITRDGKALFWDLSKSLTDPISKVDLNRDAAIERLVVHAR